MIAHGLSSFQMPSGFPRERKDAPFFWLREFKGDPLVATGSLCVAKSRKFNCVKRINTPCPKDLLHDASHLPSPPRAKLRRCVGKELECSHMRSTLPHKNSVGRLWRHIPGLILVKATFARGTVPESRYMHYTHWSKGNELVPICLRPNVAICLALI